VDREGIVPMKESSRAEQPIAARGAPRRLTRFAAVGAFGTLVNLAALHLCAGVLGLPELAAAALAVEASVLSNFALNDAFTFGERRSERSWPARFLRYHVVSGVAIAVQLAVVALAVAAAAYAGRRELGALRYPVQLTGVALGFAWTFVASSRWAWRPGSAADGEAPAASVRWSWLAPALFVALLVLHVVPIWEVRWVPTQDGPLHVENVLALLRWPSSPLLQRWYLANWGTQPNWLTQALLAPLLHVLSPRLAEKVILTGYTVLFPLSFRAVLPRGARGWWACLAVFPFVHAFPYHMGFWNFCYGVVLAFLAVGLWVRRRGRLGGWGLAALALLSILLYGAHPVAFGAAGVALAALLGARAGISLHRARGLPARRALVVRGWVRRGGHLALAMSPGAACLAAWLLAHRDHTSARIPFLELVAKLGVGYALVSIDPREVFLAAAVSLVLAVTTAHLVLLRAGRLRRGLRPADGWFLLAGLFAALYLVVPDVVASGAHVSDRLALFSFLSLVAWIGHAGSSGRPAARRAAVALASIAVAALLVRWDKQATLSSYLEEYASARAAVGRDQVLLPLALAPGGPRDAHGQKLGYRVKPFLHAAGWIVAVRGGVDLKNSQANTDQCPVRFPADRNPFRTIAASLGRMEGVPPCVDLRVSPPAGAPDVVLVWGATRENLDTPCGAALAHDLAIRYEPVFLSGPRGLLQVWRPQLVTASR
jgi:putative flippase GtrA